MESRSLRLGVVGAGYWGPNLIRVCSELGILGSVCDSDLHALQSIRTHYPGVKTVNEFDLLLKSSVQGIVIAAPAQFHAAMCLKAISAGKHVFVEKPLALSVADGELIADSARKAGTTVFVGHVLLYHPGVVKLRALLESGAIGSVCHLRSRRLSLGKLRDHENVWWSFAPHDVALMLAIMGEDVTSVRASQTALLRPDVSDVAYADFTFRNDRSSHIEVCWLDPEKSARVDVFGSGGVITFKDSRAGCELTITPFEVGSDAAGHRSISRREPTAVPVTGDEPLLAEVKAFAEAISSGKEPETSADRGVAVLRALAMAENAACEREACVPT